MKKILVVCLLLIMSTGCSNESKPDSGGSSKGREADKGISTDTKSDSFTDKQEKIAFAEKYFKFGSEVVDVEFDIYFQDNSQGFVPGPSYWNMAAAFKVEGDIDAWAGEAVKQEPGAPIDLSTWAQILEGNPGWELTSEPDVYPTDVIIYRQEKIVLVSSIGR